MESLIATSPPVEAHPSDPSPMGCQKTLTELSPACRNPGFKRSNGKSQRDRAALTVDCCVAEPANEKTPDDGCGVGCGVGYEMGSGFGCGAGFEIGCGIGYEIGCGTGYMIGGRIGCNMPQPTQSIAAMTKISIRGTLQSLPFAFI